MTQQMLITFQSLKKKFKKNSVKVDAKQQYLYQKLLKTVEN